MKISMLLHFRIIDQIDQSAYLNQPICACGWSCEIVYVQSQSFFYFIFLLGLESITSVKGQRMTILVVSYLTYGFGILEKSVIVIRDMMLDMVGWF